MGLVDDIIAQAKHAPKRILLPEAEDERTLRAAHAAETEKIAEVILVGDEAKVSRQDERTVVDRCLHDCRSEHPLHWRQEYVDEYFEMRKSKGLSRDEAATLMLDPIYFGIMMLNHGLADGMVAGGLSFDGAHVASRVADCEDVAGRLAGVELFLYDLRRHYLPICGTAAWWRILTPSSFPRLRSRTAKTAIAFGIPPIVAMLSYSTKGSAHSVLTEKSGRGDETGGGRGARAVRRGHADSH